VLIELKNRFAPSASIAKIGLGAEEFHPIKPFRRGERQGRVISLAQEHQN
jgi:hypothetical protein